MAIDLIFKNWISILTVILFAINLWSRKSFRDTESRYIWVTVISCFVLVAEGILETLAAQDPSLRFWRTLLSVIGYTVRSTAALGLLLTVLPASKRKFYLWIPCLITFALCITAFFKPVVFGFNENYDFYGGPLRYSVFVAPVLYLLGLIWVTFRNLMERKGVERFIIPAACVFCLSSALLDMFYDGNRLNEAIIISCLFFYLFLYSTDSRRDALTGLLNRQAFYDDCNTFAKKIKGVASLDMNGLKTLNDTMGHHAGDEALIRIAACIKSVVNRNVQGYRVGGDEFIILFFSLREEEIIKVQEQVKKSVEEKGHHISCGYALLEKEMSLDAAISKADELMYQDKSKYYQESGNLNNRRHNLQITE